MSSSPFLLNATIRHHLKKYETTHPELVRKLCRSIYIDDLASGGHNEEETYKIFVLSREILKDAGFNLRKFYSNSATLQAKVNPEEAVDMTLERLPLEVSPTEELEDSYSSSTLGSRQKLHSGEQKVLGMRWDMSSDQLLLDLEDMASTAMALTPTK